jgi:hypothetical protein
MTTFSTLGLNVKLRINDYQCNSTQHRVDVFKCVILIRFVLSTASYNVMLSFVKLNIVWLSVFMLSIVMMSVIMLSVI